MRALLAVTLLAACGGSSKPASTTPAAPAAPAAPTDAGAAAPAAATVEDVCKNLMSLKAKACDGFAQLEYADMAACVADLDKAKDDPRFAPSAKCVAQGSCEEVTNCLKAMQANEPKPDCGDMPVAEYEKRNGASAKKFSDVTSTKDKPVEMCGIPAENAWLVGLKCDDGSQPLHNAGDAERVRGGDLGAGGRCGSIIDVYKPTCGGKTYEIYIDAYVCPVK